MKTRWIAARVITHILQDGQSLTVALDNALKNIDSAQDRAFIQAICYGVCRYYHRLDYILGTLLDKPLKSLEVKSLLLIGLYQIKYMRVKPHAAVSETVQAARNASWAKALINAVLRGYLRRQDEIEQNAENVKTAALSHPEWLIEKLENDWSTHAHSILFENNQPPPMALRVNLTKTSREEYLSLLQNQGQAARSTPFSLSGIILEKPAPVHTLPGFNKGWISVHDSAAQIAAVLLDSRPGHRVLDVCAAPGGKAAHIIELQPDLNEVVALDIDENRMQRVRDNLQRLGQQATLIVADAVKTYEWWDGKPFDRILLDVPCSATGVIRRHPDIKLLRRAEDISTLVLQQKALLAAVWPLLAQGGLLLYATCSVLKQENELQIKDFLSAHHDAEELPITENWGVTHSLGRQVMTGEHAMDGFYYARLVKQ